MWMAVMKTVPRRKKEIQIKVLTQIRPPRRRYMMTLVETLLLHSSFRSKFSEKGVAFNLFAANST